MEIGEQQWIVLERSLPPSKGTRGRRGRPPTDPRRLFNGILWILRTGAPWRDLPDCYPPYQTVHRWFQKWAESGVFTKLLHRLAIDLSDRGKIDLREAFIDGSFASAKEGGDLVGKTKRGKGTKIMAISEKSGLPLAIDVASASPHETKLVFKTLEKLFVSDLPHRLIGDKAYDSDGLDRRLKDECGIELIAPHRRNRRRRKTQDGRCLRRYRKRWRVERLFAWLQSYRRLVVRYEYYANNFLDFLNLACLLILLRHY